MRRLKVSYKVQTLPSDGLGGIEIEFVPWQNNCLNILRITTRFWQELPSLLPYLKHRNYSLDDFTVEQQDKIKKIIIDEYGYFVELCRAPCADFDPAKAWLRDHYGKKQS